MKQISTQFKNELRASTTDLGYFFLFCLVTASIWVFLFQWRPGYLISHGDATQYAYPFLYQARELGGSWLDWVYDPRLLGGVKPSASSVIPTYMDFFLRLKFSAEAVYNIGAFFWHVCFGYLGMICSLHLAQIFHDSSNTHAKEFPFWLRLAIFLLHVFSPFFAWRLTGGHILYTLLFLPALLAIYLGLTKKSISAGHFFLFLFIFYNSAQTISYPFVLNIFIFGAPIIAAIIYCLPKPDLRSFIWAGICVFLCALLAIPVQIPALAHFSSSDAARSLSSSPLVYAFLQGTWNDWLTSIPWNLQVFDNARNSAIWGEVNFAFGPLLLLLFFLPKKMRLIGLGFLLSMFLIIVYANDIQPFSNIIFKIFPVLLQFRVPNRAAFAISFLLPTISGAILLNRSSSWPLFTENRQRTLIAIISLAAGIIFFLPSWIHEILCWFSALMVLPATVMRRKEFFVGDRAVFLCLLVFLSAIAFMQRMAAPENFLRTTEEIEKVRSRILAQAPQLISPLSRAQFFFTSTKFYTNTAYTLGISTLDGYSQPQYRFSKLVLALNGQEFNPQSMNFNISKQEGIFRALAKIYNACCEIQMDANGPNVKIVEPLDMPAWFSQKIIYTKDFFSLAKALATSSTDKNTLVLQNAILVEEDSVVKKNAGSLPQADCSKNTVNKWIVEKTTFSFHLEIFSPQTCLLNIATNFAENLEATNEKGEKITLLPSYGSLLGLIVPAGSKKITISAKDRLPSHFSLLHWIGCFLTVGTCIAAYFAIRKRFCVG